MSKEKLYGITAEEILKVADEAYPDHCIQIAMKGKRVDDTLATFIVDEVRSVTDPNGSRTGNINEVVRALNVAISELEKVRNAVEAME